MKTNHQKLVNIASIIFAPILYIFFLRRGKILLPIILFGILMAGCFKHFYEIKSENVVRSAMVDSLANSNKYFIAHYSDSTVLLQNLKSDGSAIEANVMSLPEDLLSEAYARRNASLSYKPKKEPNLVSQVHFFIDKNLQSVKTENSQKVSIPLQSITRMDIFGKDRGRTTTNQVFSYIGVSLLSILVIGFAAALISCNCPQVSIQNGDQLEFKSGLYSGAVNSNLERSDYLLLDNFSPAQDSLHIRIDNVHGEQQFINRLQLLKVSHPLGTKVLADRNGKVYTYNAPFTPLSVIDNAGREYNNQVRYLDSENAGFIEPGKDAAASSLIFHFPVNMAGKKARLILRASNTPWSGYLYREFQGLYGNAYTMMREKQEKKDPSVSQNWIINQSLPLKVYVENAKGEWQMADYFQMAGNTAKRDMVMELDIPQTPFQTVRIKLETVYRFWEIDYAALDYTEQTGIETKIISPTKAIVSSGENVMDKISATDKNYLSLNGQAYLDLQYRDLTVNNNTESYFLCGTGYYHQSPVSTGKPDVAALKQFKHPGSFQLFSLREYEKVSVAFSINEDIRKNGKPGN